MSIEGAPRGKLARLIAKIVALAKENAENW